MNRAEAKMGGLSKENQSPCLENPSDTPTCENAMAKEESRKPRTAGAAAASEQGSVENHQPDLELRIQQQFQDIKSENNELRHRLRTCQQELSGYQETARLSLARAKEFEVQNRSLLERCVDAESILLRLRPQREHCTETEVKGDYELLKASIQAWVDNNCGTFLDNDELGCEMIGENPLVKHGGQLQGYEIVLENFRPQSNRWDDAKDQLLIAIIMRYIVEKILNHPYPVGLSVDGQALLDKIEKSMESLTPRRDLQTRRDWRSDTITALFNHDKFADEQANSAKKLAKNLFKIIRQTLPNSSDRNTASEAITSLQAEIIAPSQLLAQKLQCASSHWRFEYSPHWKRPPGCPAKNLPQFFENIANYQCRNLSKSRKTLKPASDLATKDQQNSLVYVLDLYPGLYCSRVDVDNFLPDMTITQPVLLVDFLVPKSRERDTAPQPGEKREDGGHAVGSSTAKKTSLISRLLGQ